MNSDTDDSESTRDLRRRAEAKVRDSRDEAPELTLETGLR